MFCVHNGQVYLGNDTQLTTTNSQLKTKKNDIFAFIYLATS